MILEVFTGLSSCGLITQIDKIWQVMSPFVPPGFDYTALAGSLLISIEMQYCYKQFEKKLGSKCSGHLF